VRAAWQTDPARLEALFDEIAVVVNNGRQAIVQGGALRLGPLMTRNHKLLTGLEVSSPQLGRLVESALAAGALGAKMSGGGMGGNMVALVPPDLRSKIAETLRSNGAVNVIQTEVAP
jgi:mevalonate kinase